MKKIILLAALLIATFAANAQKDESRREWLGTFSSISLEGDMKVTLVPIEEGAQPMLIIKSEDLESSKLKYTINNKGELTVRESNNRNRTRRTEIEIHYLSLGTIKIAGSDVDVVGLIEQPILDVEVSNGGFLKAEVDVQDVAVKANGQSTIDLKGRSRYLTVDVAVAKLDLRHLEVMSADVSVTQRGEVSVYATERLAADAGFGGVVFYRGNPTILRANTKVGSSVNSIE